MCGCGGEVCVCTGACVCVRLLEVDSAPRTALATAALGHFSASVSLLEDGHSITAAPLETWQPSQRL